MVLRSFFEVTALRRSFAEYALGVSQCKMEGSDSPMQWGTAFKLSQLINPLADVDVEVATCDGEEDPSANALTPTFSSWPVAEENVEETTH